MKILLAVDGSGPSLLAARFARRLYHGMKAGEIVVVHVGDSPEGARAACALLEEDGVPFELEVGPGDAAEMIVERSQQHHCDLIVMGARGLGGVRATLLGSVSAKVAQTSGVPVTLVS